VGIFGHFAPGDGELLADFLVDSLLTSSLTLVETLGGNLVFGNLGFRINLGINHGHIKLFRADCVTRLWPGSGNVASLTRVTPRDLKPTISRFSCELRCEPMFCEPEHRQEATGTDGLIFFAAYFRAYFLFAYQRISHETFINIHDFGFSGFSSGRSCARNSV
jgi:hypothetical protein